MNKYLSELNGQARESARLLIKDCIDERFVSLEEMQEIAGKFLAEHYPDCRVDILGLCSGLFERQSIKKRREDQTK